MGRSAGAEAVMSARLVSMAEVTKPTLWEAALGKMGMLKRPWMSITRRMMEVIVTLWCGYVVSKVILERGKGGVIKGVTYRKPRRKTIKSAVLVRFGIRSDEKIQSGNPRIKMSVMMLKTEVEMYNTRRSTH
jgi:hypothetical protein